MAEKDKQTNAQSLGSIEPTSNEFEIVDKDLPAFEEDNVDKGMNAVMNFFRNAKTKIGDFFKEITSMDDQPQGNLNIHFYNNEIPFYPNGENIEYILKNWKGKYKILDQNHCFIQWLFPNRMPGMNTYAHVLTDEDVKHINGSPELKGRVKRAFEMMLDYYGMRLTKENQFELAENFRERLMALNRRYNHNYLRITRILLAIKELGHKDLMLPWLKFMADLVYKRKLLNYAEESLENYWHDTLDAQDFLNLKDYLQQCKSIKSTEEKKIATLRNTSMGMHESSADTIFTKHPVPQKINTANTKYINETDNSLGTNMLNKTNITHNTNAYATLDNKKSTLQGTPSGISSLATPSNTHNSEEDTITGLVHL